jgi:hypothetical protein
MTDVEELEFLGVWMIDIGQSMRDLSAALQQCYEKLRREAKLADEDLSDGKAADLRKAGSAPFQS